jgi:hypothetical protein
MNIPIFNIDEDSRPRWLQVFSETVRPGGVALMFFFLTILPLIFAIIELGIEGAGTKLAGVLAAYFKAVPDVYYTTLQVLFVAYVAGKSGERVADSIAKGKSNSTDIANAKTVNVDQRKVEPDAPNG